MSTEKEEKEKLPEINPAFKISVGSNISNPIPDDEYMNKEGSKSLKFILICIIIDFFITSIMLLQDYEFLLEQTENEILEFVSRIVLSFVCFSSLIIFFCLRKLIIAHVARWAYFILGLIYYCVILGLRILKLIYIIKETEKSIVIPIIFLSITAFTIIPRIIVFFKSRKYLKKLKILYQIKRLEEQEQFVESIAKRIEKGYQRWSNPNANISEDEETSEEDKSKFLFEKSESNINDDTTEENDLNKIEEIMRKSGENEE